jgi:GPI ethanolamine phosphate transferase 1
LLTTGTLGDGLRADKAFQSFPDPSPPPSEVGTEAALKPRPLAPFLRSRVLDHGTFGVSHTRVPTESRPGHVALIAGLYEDVSAVMTGWKLNPVNFDSVFNRSTHTWSWGSPDILPMFKEGAVPGRVDAEMYGAEAEDFTSDSTSLDTWVFNHTRNLFESAKSGVNPELDAQLRQDGNVFFLHLLGLDTAGHGFRPYSKEYLHNIKVVDQGVEEVTSMIENFFGDGKTAFVFTADHGMSDWGSHGDGHPDNTRTPLIAWGSGVARPVTVPKGQIAPGHDELSSDWNLDHVQRHDVLQADVAALMAYLVGLEFPVNGEGELPTAFVQATPKEKAEALLVNARQICEMYHVKEANKRATVIGYRPFPGLAGSNNSTGRIAQIRQLIDEGAAEGDAGAEKLQLAMQQAEELMKIALSGLRYLQTYDWLFLRALVTIGYLGWIVFAIATVIDLHVLHGSAPEQRSIVSVGAFGAVLVALYAVLIIQRSSWTYYAYAIFPVAFWEEIFARRAALIEGSGILFGKRDSKGWAMVALKAVGFIGLLEALVRIHFRVQLPNIVALTEYLLGTILLLP